jgi:hypothetical protein
MKHLNYGGGCFNILNDISSFLGGQPVRHNPLASVVKSFIIILFSQLYVHKEQGTYKTFT